MGSQASSIDIMTTNSTTVPGALVLVASEDPDVRDALRDLLARCGADVIVARTVVDAIAELHGVDFDVAIVDVALPPRGSEDLIRVAKELSPDTGVVVMLRPESLDRTIECVRAGAVDFIHFPIEEGELQAVVGRALEHRRLRATAAMFRASHAILVGTQVQELPKVLVELAADMLECDGVCLMRRGAKGELYVTDAHRMARADDTDELLALTEHVTSGLTSAAPLLLPDDIVGGRDLLFGYKRVRAALACPIVIDGRIGVVLAAMRSTDPRPFRRADAERAGVVASQICLALANAQLVQKVAGAQRLAAIGEVAASVAHEINNPLVYVLANCEMAREAIAALDRGVGARQLVEIESMLEDATEGAERIRDIARDLRTLARTEETHAVFDVNGSVQSALRIAAASLRGVVTVALDLAPGAMVEGSAARISQVLINLFVNAAQAATSCGRRIVLRIDTKCTEERVVMTVRDDGPGIAAGHLVRIFEPYFTTKSASNGTGLGLSISRTIIEEHGGTMTLASEPGNGATFVIELPRTAVAKETEGPLHAVATATGPAGRAA